MRKGYSSLMGEGVMRVGKVARKGNRGEGISHREEGRAERRRLAWVYRLPRLWRGWRLCAVVGMIGRRVPIMHAG